ncbi:ankyrin repeat-containing domain protein [Coniochaeta sp. 2T2.1]|nr:ankyrin repeat-containing domain protein [Coniochaeta sp. 2T2.1]
MSLVCLMTRIRGMLERSGTAKTNTELRDFGTVIWFGVLTETDGEYVEIRNLAIQICTEIGPRAALRDVVHRLCWMALERATCVPGRPGSRWWVSSDERENASNHNPGVSLLAAATHFNLVPLVERLLAEGHAPTSHNCLFYPAMQVAAIDGNFGLLDLFQRHLPEFGPLGRVHIWHGKIGPCSIIGAAIRGDMGVLAYALYPPSRANPDSTDMLDQTYGRVEENSRISGAILRAMSVTNKPEVFDYLRGALGGQPFTEEELYLKIVVHAQRGNLEMVRYLLDLGVPVQMENRRRVDAPLVQACKSCHEDVVDLLLARGADPNCGACVQNIRPRRALPMAAKSGSLAIVRKLLDHGAYVNEVYDHPGHVPAIWYAFYLEHTAMIRLLQERGATLNGGIDSWFEG